MFVYGDYPKVIELLLPLVEPQIRLEEAADISRAYELLGLTHFFLGDREHAEEYFGALARRDPDKRLDPVVVPPEAVAFFRAIRAKLAAEINAAKEALAKKRREEAERRRLENTLVQVEEYERHSRFVAVLPFGIGQFQNGARGLGALFLSTELVAVGLSVGFAISVENLRQADGRFRRGSADQAYTLQTAQLISGWSAVGLIVAGAAQALFDLELRPKIKTWKPVPLELQLTPKLHPRGGGAALGFSF